MNHAQTPSPLFLFQLFSIIHGTLQRVFVNIRDDDAPVLDGGVVAARVELVPCGRERVCEAPYVPDGVVSRLLKELCDFAAESRAGFYARCLTRTRRAMMIGTWDDIWFGLPAHQNGGFRLEALRPPEGT